MSGCSGPFRQSLYISKDVYLTYVRKNKGVSPASSVYENSDLRLVSISFIHALALVLLLKGER